MDNLTSVIEQSGVSLSTKTQRSLQWYVLSELQKANSHKEFSTLKNRLSLWFKRKQDTPAQIYTFYLIQQIQRDDSAGTCYFADLTQFSAGFSTPSAKAPQLSLITNPHYQELDDYEDSIWGEEL